VRGKQHGRAIWWMSTKCSRNKRVFTLSSHVTLTFHLLTHNQSSTKVPEDHITCVKLGDARSVIFLNLSREYRHSYTVTDRRSAPRGREWILTRKTTLVVTSTAVTKAFRQFRHRSRHDGDSSNPVSEMQCAPPGDRRRRTIGVTHTTSPHSPPSAPMTPSAWLWWKQRQHEYSTAMPKREFVLGSSAERAEGFHRMIRLCSSLNQGAPSFSTLIFHDFSMTNKWKSMTYRHNI